MSVYGVPKVLLIFILRGGLGLKLKHFKSLLVFCARSRCINVARILSCCQEVVNRQPVNGKVENDVQKVAEAVILFLKKKYVAEWIAIVQERPVEQSIGDEVKETGSESTIARSVL